MSTVSSGLNRETASRLTGADVPLWKLELNQRLVAARARRNGQVERTQRPKTATPKDRHEDDKHRAADVAAAVARRFAQAPTYEELLAREALIAAEAATVAAHEEQAATEELLTSLEAAEQTQTCEEVETEARPQDLGSHRVELDPEIQHHLDAIQARLAAREAAREREPAFRPSQPVLQDPMAEVVVEPATLLNANLIEFPRELVAAKKARPRLAEGPLRQDASEADAPALRIFEAERPQASRASAAASPEWSSAIRLDAAPSAEAQLHARHSAMELPLKTAPLGDRIMAAIVDGALASIGYLMFVFAFYACSPHPPVGRVAVASAAVAFAVVMVLYQALFFGFGEATPGMRYARIALWSFADAAPSRKAMRLRIGALMLAAFPVGLGLLWAMFDEDRLGWHDRISGTYQRSRR